MKVFLARHPDTQLRVAGGGVGAKYYKNLPNTKLLGPLPPAKMAEFYRSLSVFVDPHYHYSGVNIVMPEAMLSGVPVISSDVPSSLTIIPSKEFGLRFENGNTTALVEALEEVYQNSSNMG